jgi:hypothetical protein
MAASARERIAELEAEVAGLREQARLVQQVALGVDHVRAAMVATRKPELEDLMRQAITEVRACQEAVAGAGSDTPGLGACAGSLGELAAAIKSAAAAVVIADAAWGPVHPGPRRDRLQLVRGGRQGTDSRDGGAR